MRKDFFVVGLLIARIATAQVGLRPAWPASSAHAAAVTPSAVEAAPKVSQSLRAKAERGETLQVFLALSSQIDRRQVSRIRSLYASQIEAFDRQTRIVSPSDRFAARHRQEAAAERDRLVKVER